MSNHNPFNQDASLLGEKYDLPEGESGISTGSTNPFLTDADATPDEEFAGLFPERYTSSPIQTCTALLRTQFEPKAPEEELDESFTSDMSGMSVVEYFDGVNKDPSELIQHILPIIQQHLSPKDFLTCKVNLHAIAKKAFEIWNDRLDKGDSAGEFKLLPEALREIHTMTTATPSKNNSTLVHRACDTLAQLITKPEPNLKVVEHVIKTINPVYLKPTSARSNDDFDDDKVERILKDYLDDDDQ